MKSARLIGFILVALLTMTAFIRPRAIAQQDEAAALDKSLGELYGAGKFSEALPLAQRALAIREKALGPNHPNVARSLYNLARLYAIQFRNAEAEPLYKRALAIYEKALGGAHPDVATALSSLGDLYRAQGRYADAEPLYKRALAIFEKALGPDHPCPDGGRLSHPVGNLGSKATHSGGPPFRRFGTRSFYRWGDAIDWAERFTLRSRPNSERDGDAPVIAGP